MRAMKTVMFRSEDLTKFHLDRDWNEVAICPVCLSDPKDFVDWTSVDCLFKASRCSNCSFVFINPLPSSATLNEYYNGYIDRIRLSRPEKMELRDRQYQLDASLLRRFVKTGKLLDVGCGGGYFLNALSDSYNRYGCELDPRALEVLRDQFPGLAERVFHCSVNDLLDMNIRGFDIITLRGVIEHVLEIEALVESVTRICNDGGLLYICATPNVDCLTADLYRENWNLFHPVQHIWMFSRDTVEKLFQRGGWALVWSEYQYLSTPYADPQNDLIEIADYLSQKGGPNRVSPPFYESMLSLIFRKD